MNRLGFNSSHWNCQLSHFTFRQLHLKTFRVSDFKYRSFTSRLTWACHLGVYSCKPIWWSKSARVAHEESDFRKFDWILSKSIFRTQSHPAGFILRLNSMSCPYIRFITLWPGIFPLIQEHSPDFDSTPFRLPISESKKYYNFGLPSSNNLFSYLDGCGLLANMRRPRREF